MVLSTSGIRIPLFRELPDRPSGRDVYIIDKTSEGSEIHLAGGDIGAGEDVSSSIKLHRRKTRWKRV